MAQTDIKHEAKKGFYWTFFNQFVNYGLTFIVGIVMARLLSPSDYGITAIPAIFITIARVFIDSGFQTALIRKPEVSEEDLSTAFFYSFAVGVLCYILLFFGAPFIADFFQVEVVKPLVRVTALMFLWTPLTTPQNVILSRKLDFKTISKVSIATQFVGSAVGVISAYCGLGLWALVISNVVSSLLEFTFKWFAVRWFPKSRWSKQSFKYLWDYGNKVIMSSLLGTAYRAILPAFVAKFQSPVDLGLYNRAYKYAELPSEQGTITIQKVTFPILSKIQDDETLARGYRKILRVTVFVLFPVMFMLSALARPVIVLMLTEKWEGCVILLQFLCFSAMWYPVHAININLLQVKGRSDLILKLEIIKIIINFIVLSISLPFGVLYFCMATCVNSIFSLIVNTFYTGKMIQVGFWVQMKDIFPTIILCFATWGAILLVNLQFENLWVELIVGGIVGLSVYAGGALLFRFPEIKEVKYMISKK